MKRKIETGEFTENKKQKIDTKAKLNNDKVKGLFYGAAMGDALGAPFEFKSNKLKYNGNLEYPLVLKTRFGHEFKRPVGSVTDDTEMMLVILHYIAENNEYEKYAMIEKYLKWGNDKGSNFMGKNTRTLFRSVKSLKGYRKRYMEMTSEEPSKWTQSNGALMRCAILAILDTKDWIVDCKLTNPSRICVDTNRVYIYLLRQILNGRTDIENIVKECLKESEREEIKYVIQEALDKKDRDITKIGRAWCLHGLYCAFYSILHIENHKKAMEWIILKKGDTDTNACIAGAVFGALYGFEKIYSDDKENFDILMNLDTDRGEYSVKSAEKYFN